MDHSLGSITVQVINQDTCRQRQNCTNATTVPDDVHCIAVLQNKVFSRCANVFSERVQYSRAEQTAACFMLWAYRMQNHI